jgi:uncharacterized protein with ATP-grasp and redox domains
MVCAERVALEAAQEDTNDAGGGVKVLVSRMMEILRGPTYEKVDICPVGRWMMQVIEEVTGRSDPYKDFRRRNTASSSTASVLRRGTFPSITSSRVSPFRVMRNTRRWFTL